MIKVEKNNVEVKGSVTEVKSEFCMLVSALKECDIDKEEVIDMVEKGFMSDEELQKHAKECVAEIADMFAKAFAKFAKEGGESDE